MLAFPKPQNRPFPTTRSCVITALVVALLAAVSFVYRLSAQPHFVDESAYISQTYFLELLTQPNHPYWIEYPGYDLPPLPKYAIAVALLAGGERLPRHEAMKRWYDDTSTRPETPNGLWWARLPSVVFGALGCAAICVLGMLTTGRWIGGVLAAGLLAANPLYRMHARRAMSDVYAEAMILFCLAIAMATWRAGLGRALRRRAWIGATLLMGITAGLAVLSKLNGGLALMILGAWSALGLGLKTFPIGRRVAFASATLATGAIAYATFTVANPFLWSHPRGALPPQMARIAAETLIGRTVEVIRHRVTVSRTGQSQFPNDALVTVRDKVTAFAVQGFGRFGAFGPSAADSTRRFDRSQDFGAPIWGMCVLAGAVWAAWNGRNQLERGEPPTAFALLVQSLVSFLTVMLFLPLAWDRYFLSIQPSAILLATGLAVAALPTRRTTAPTSVED